MLTFEAGNERLRRNEKQSVTVNVAHVHAHCTHTHIVLCEKKLAIGNKCHQHSVAISTVAHQEPSQKGGAQLAQAIENARKAGR